MALSSKLQSQSLATCSRRSGVSCPVFQSRSNVCSISRPARQCPRGLVVRAAQVADFKREKVDLSNVEQDPNMLKLPFGYHWYETMLVLRATLSDEERDKELAKFEAFLNKEECMHINALVRGRSRMAYPIKSSWEGIYVLYTYAAKRQTARTVQLLLSNPEAGSEDKVLRHITFCKY
eukprot:jgi/Chrzof1/10265/Cz04g34230.t1